MIQLFLKIYERIFANTFFYKFNKFLFVAAAKGLGLDSGGAMSEKGETTFLKLFFSKNASLNDLVIFDVGANVGNYATKIMEMQPLARLYAFEPHPETFKKLVQKASQKGFTAINKGCGENTGSIKFYDYASDAEGSEHATMLKGVLEDIHHSEAKEFEVEVITIDEFSRNNGIDHIHLLKIDTEGFEFSVLKGCERMLAAKQIDAVHFEFNSMNMISRVYFFDFIKLLHNYKLYRVVSNGLIPIEHNNHLLSEIFVFQNIIALKQ